MGTVARWWYGADPVWALPFERDAKRKYGTLIRRDLFERTLLYRHAGLEIPGRSEPVPVAVRFEKTPCYETFGLRPEDYPRVFADHGFPSPHRMPDGSLCLYYPLDPVERRWIAADGLLALLNIAADHIFYETYWRRTGGKGRGRWLGDEAPHGIRRRVA